MIKDALSKKVSGVYIPRLLHALPALLPYLSILQSALEANAGEDSV